MYEHAGMARDSLLLGISSWKGKDFLTSWLRQRIAFIFIKNSLNYLNLFNTH